VGIFPVGCCGCEAGPTLASVIVVSSRFSEPPPRNALPENSLELLTITTRSVAIPRQNCAGT